MDIYQLLQGSSESSISLTWFQVPFSHLQILILLGWLMAKWLLMMFQLILMPHSVSTTVSRVFSMALRISLTLKQMILTARLVLQASIWYDLPFIRDQEMSLIEDIQGVGYSIFCHSSLSALCIIKYKVGVYEDFQGLMSLRAVHTDLLQVVFESLVPIASIMLSSEDLFQVKQLSPISLMLWVIIFCQSLTLVRFLAWQNLIYPSAATVANNSPISCRGENLMSSMPASESANLACSVQGPMVFWQILTLLSRLQVAKICPNSGLAHFTLQSGPPLTCMVSSLAHLPSGVLMQMQIFLSEELTAILFPHQSKLMSWMMSRLKLAMISAGLSSIFC